MLKTIHAVFDNGVFRPTEAVHVPFQAMRRLGTTETLANDKHFEAAGFSVLF